MRLSAADVWVEPSCPSVYPKNRNYCVQFYPKLQKCVSHVYVFFICSPTCSVPQFFIPRRLFPRHDEALIFKAASYSSRCKGAGCMLIQHVPCVHLILFVHGSHVSPEVRECVSRVYPKNNKWVSRVVRATRYPHLCFGCHAQGHCCLLRRKFSTKAGCPNGPI